MEIKKSENFDQIEKEVKFSLLKKLMLYFSFNRYTYLILAGTFAVIFPIILFLFSWWWLWVPLCLIGLWFLKFSFNIHAQTSKKFHITKKWIFNIKHENAEMDEMIKYCEDPCYRVVAKEILIQKGIGSKERKKIINDYKEEAIKRNKMIIIVDKKNGVIYKTVDGKLEKSKIGKGDNDASTIN
jgi:hypothetical protein